VSPRAIPEALRPLPIRVRPRPAETVASYVVRLARANHLPSAYLHAYLCGPPNWHGAADFERLAVLCGRPVAVLQRVLTGPAPARTPTPKPPSRSPQPPTVPGTPTGPATRGRPARTGRVVDRKVSNTGMISYAGARYNVARALAGQRVQVTRTDSVVQIFQGEQLLRTWSRDHHSPANQAPISVVVDRKVWGTGRISYAGALYGVARALAGQLVQVTVDDGMVRISQDGQLLRSWPRRHPPAKELLIRPHFETGTSPASRTDQPIPAVMMSSPVTQASHVVNRKVSSSGAISLAKTSYSVARALAGQLVQVTVDDGMVRISQEGQLLRSWPRRHPPAKELLIRPDRSHQSGEVTRDQAHRLAPLDDLDTDPSVVHRLVDQRGLLSFAGRYYGAGRALAGQVVQVRCAGGIVQVTHGGELVHAWQQRHTPEQEQRMLQRPNLQQRIANAGY
jgi:hypothetical protein